MGKNINVSCDQIRKAAKIKEVMTELVHNYFDVATVTTPMISVFFVLTDTL